MIDTRDISHQRRIGRGMVVQKTRVDYLEPNDSKRGGPMSVHGCAADVNCRFLAKVRGGRCVVHGGPTTRENCSACVHGMLAGAHVHRDGTKG